MHLPRQYFPLSFVDTYGTIHDHVSVYFAAFFSYEFSFLKTHIYFCLKNKVTKITIYTR